MKQAIDPYCGNCQHGDLAQSIEATEVDQDDVDHVGSTASGYAVLEKERGNAVIRPTQDRIGKQGHHGAKGRRNDQIAETAQTTRLDRRTVRHEKQGQDQQDDSHYLN